MEPNQNNETPNTEINKSPSEKEMVATGSVVDNNKINDGNNEGTKMMEAPVEKKRGNRGLKVVATVFCLTTLASAGALAFTMINDVSQKNKLGDELRASKEEVQKANEVIAKYENATGTKAVEKIGDNLSVKEIVKPMPFDVKVKDLISTIKAGFKKTLGKTSEGLEIKDHFPIIHFSSIFTNSDASYVFAELGIGHAFEVIKNEKGETRTEYGVGGASASYYRAFPNGSWKKAYEGNGFENCNNVSEEAKKVYSGVKDPEGKSILHCLDNNGNIVHF